MTYTQIKAEAAKRMDILFQECGVFWAFSNEQFEKNKTPLQPGEKYTRLGSGGFLPSHSVDKLMAGTDEIEAWRKQAVKDSKNDEQVILYELNNYEAFYTCDISDAMEALADLGYTKEQVQAVYKKYRNKVGV